MKSLLILLAFSTIVISSCTTAYKAGQTPDDVYYSPERPQREYVRVEDNDDRSYRNNDQYYEERQLRMKVRNRTRWSELDDWYYYNNRYNYYSNYNPVNWNNPWSNYTYWNYYYNPYSPKGYVIVNPRATSTYNKPRTFNLNTYIPSSGSSNTNTKSINNYSNKNSNDSYNTNSRRDAGSVLRDIFRSSSNNNSGSSSSSSNNNNNSSSSNSSSNNSSSSGSSGGSAPVRKF